MLENKRLLFQWVWPRKSVVYYQFNINGMHAVWCGNDAGDANDIAVRTDIIALNPEWKD